MEPVAPVLELEELLLEELEDELLEELELDDEELLEVELDDDELLTSPPSPPHALSVTAATAAANNLKCDI